MFTGIVEARGRVAALREGRLTLEPTPLAADGEIGDSLAVNGVCLTVTSRKDGALAFDLAEETLARTTLGSLSPGDGVNLERPVTLLSRLGGHLVQGHVDGVATVTEVRRAGSGAEMTIRVPDGLSRYLVERGSVAVDGVSLTVTGLQEDGFTVALVPHTLAATTLGDRAAGDTVNLEVDVLAKYVERLAAPHVVPAEAP